LHKLTNVQKIILCKTTDLRMIAAPDETTSSKNDIHYNSWAQCQVVM